MFGVGMFAPKSFRRRSLDKMWESLRRGAPLGIYIDEWIRLQMKVEYEVSQETAGMVCLLTMMVHDGDDAPQW